MADEVKTNTNGEVDYKALYEQSQGDLARYKSSIDKLTGENAEYKRKERERMTDEDKRNAELAEREKRYAEIERENALYKYKASLGSIIKDEKVLAEVAECYANGDIAMAIGKQNAYILKAQGELEKTIRAELLKENPQPNPDVNVGGLTQEQFDKMDVVERTKVYNEQPELYKKFMNK